MTNIDNIIKSGNIEEFNKAVQHGVGWEKVANSSAFHGQKEMLDIAIKNFDANHLIIACSAARGGHLDIVYYMLDSCDTQPEYFNCIASAAALFGHRYIVKEMVKIGANDFDGIALDAAMKHRPEIVIDMIELGADVPKLIRAILC